MDMDIMKIIKKELNMKENGKIRWEMDMVLKIMKKEVFIEELFWMEKNMELGYISGWINLLMKVNGQIII